ncbi:MAG TPA: hypothetical protein DCR40_19530 [Prolixibacteraceae bacterium]|nr:hypothetical protein [Prolixibacteraceae bacterium]
MIVAALSGCFPLEKPCFADPGHSFLLLALYPSGLLFWMEQAFGTGHWVVESVACIFLTGSYSKPDLACRNP